MLVLCSELHRSSDSVEGSTFVGSLLLMFGGASVDNCVLSVNS